MTSAPEPPPQLPANRLGPKAAPPDTAPDDGSGSTSGPPVPQVSAAVPSGMESLSGASIIAGASLVASPPGRWGLPPVVASLSPQPHSASAIAHSCLRIRPPLEKSAHAQSIRGAKQEAYVSA